MNAPTELADGGVYTTAEICAILKVSRKKLRALHLPSVDLGPRSKRYLGRQVREVLYGEAA